MTCPHTNWTLDADLRLDGGCIQCWKERAEKSEAVLDKMIVQRDQALHLLSGGTLTEKEVDDSGLGRGVLSEKRHYEDRAEKAEAAAAELLTYATQLARDMESIVAWKLPPSYHAFMKRDHQPENDYGHGYLPPDKARVLVEALETLRSGFNTDSVEWEIATKALAQLKNTQ